nr:DUF4982 domain-containing protein [Lachnospiraceae bacterium]
MRKLWNKDWEFSLSRTKDELSDRWKPVTLPHDWLIYDTTDLYRDGYGRYRKVFDVDADRIRSSGAHVFIVFDGVYMDSAYYLNGEQIGEWKYGYSQYVLELPADKLIRGQNELVVGVNFRSPNSRWYSGAGIYRDVTYVESPAVYIPENGVYTHVEEADEGYLLYVDTVIRSGDDAVSQDKYIVCSELYDADGKPIVMEAADASVDTTPYVRPDEEPYSTSVYLVREPELWSVDSPYLYKLETRLSAAGENASPDGGDGSVLQTVTTSIGFRNIRFDPNEGFFVNGRHMKLNGVCEHHDLGVLGAEFHKSAMRRKLEILRGMGVNAIRGTHNMMATGLLELCDEMGFFYISEGFDMWNHPKTEYDYARFFDDWHESDVASWIRRDRDHPCVIMWSIGNEIADIHNYEKEGQEMTRHLMDLVASHDYRANAYITQGSNYMPWENAQKCADILKVAGYNYGEACYEEHHREHPDWIIYGSETSSITHSRGVYHLPLSANSLGEEDEQCSALGNSTTSWSAKSYEACVCIDRDTPYSLGQFIWSGFDYIGEPTPYKTRSCYFGQIDTAGFPKDVYYIWKSAWMSPDRESFVHVFPYWDFNPGQTVDVRVVSNLPEVELFINGRSLGRQELDHAPGSGHHLIADYRLPYEAGELKAVAYRSAGSFDICAESSRHSFGNTDHIVWKRFRFTSVDIPQNIAFYEITAIDREENIVENACDRVQARVLSGGRLIGLDNGDSADPDGYRVDNRRLFNGHLLAAVEVDTDAAIDPEVDFSIVDDRPDVRRITLICDESRTLDADHRTVRVRSAIEPPTASWCDIQYRIVDDMGNTSYLAESEVEHRADSDDIITIRAKGDGDFRLRATAGGDGQKVRVISDLDFTISGCGQAFRDPYSFVAGSTYSSSIGEVGSGNEKGFATARGERTVVTFDNLDFGPFGADRITIPIFAMDSDDVPLKVWKGVPGSGTERLLLDTVYSKPRQWAVFIEDTWSLNERVSGITSISFEFECKVHVKGFIFRMADKARSTLLATEADAIYGDEFRKCDQRIEKIGNNVSLEFKDMDFGDYGIKSLTICGRTPNPVNPVHVRFFRGEESVREVCEFRGCPEPDGSQSD